MQKNVETSGQQVLTQLFFSFRESLWSHKEAALAIFLHKFPDCIKA